eukprot:CAMPEP_0202711274 /NCGR_PEP_ID=MMETSP1385-20130828/23099_1 /ASSEMBLY_ACC=CAM_ASM_000861 /TAXON_ID=933848 /ORGANISM="Elphidium margaritaceum" /LENGTH=793 /DNA_ID=CAMNT_0049370969 /DNA_START=56 /DNA_END=2437 /DNA_ORIENTATION=-
MSLWFIAFALILRFGGAVVVENSTCETEGQACGEDPECEPILTQYLTDCEDIFAVTNGTGELMWQEGWCPSACKESLRAYLSYVYPDQLSTDICTCASADCEVKRTQLFDQKCVAPDCAGLFAECEADTDCAPLAAAYLDVCEPVLGLADPTADPQWTYNFCPQDCQVALDAYVNSVAPGYTSLRFCDCNGEETCIESKARLENTGCATPDCQQQFAECLSDAQCLPLAETYLAACDSVLAGSSSAFCPSDCQTAFDAYLGFVAPGSTTLNSCTCSFEPNCEEGKNNLIDAGCAAKDCQQLWLDCTEDVDCEPIAVEYFAQCEMVFNGSWTADWCPASCVSALATYVYTAISEFGFSNPLDFCDCNGEGECQAGFDRLLSAKCFTPDCEKLHMEQCMPNENCVEAHGLYMSACEGVFNGTVVDYCPSECAYRMSEYLPFITDRVEPPICSCSPDPDNDCQLYSERIIGAGCLKQNCDQMWYNCEQDTECAAIAAEYLVACEDVITMDASIAECPSACSTALGAYIAAASLMDTYNPVDGTFCDCGESADCDAIQAHIIEIGCIPKNCEFEFGYCLADAECAPIADAYLAACEPLLEGSLSSATQCPVDCMQTFQAYIAQVYNGTQEDSISDYCQCSPGNDGCTAAMAELDRLSCNDADDCTYRDYQCSLDSDCAPLRDAYFAACQIFVNGTYLDAGLSFDSCPLECGVALRAYVDQLYGGVVEDQLLGEYCNCNANTQCTAISGVFDTLQCLAEESPTTTTADDPGDTGGDASALVVKSAVLFVAFVVCHILF